MGLPNNIKKVTVDLATNLRRIWEMSRFEFRLLYRESRLGMVWAILSPLVQIGAYWFVFGVGLRERGNIGDLPYLVWMVPGITAWFFLTKALPGGSGELRNKATMLSRVTIGPYLLLASRLLAQLFEHIGMLIIMFAILLANGWRPDVYAFNLVYYVVASFCFALAFDMVFSVLTLIAEDFKRVLSMVLRLLFFLMPILWMPEPGKMDWFFTIQKYNPLYYVVKGYRDSLLYQTPFWRDTETLLIFWAITVVLYLIGCQWQSRVRDRIADFV